MTAFEDAGAAIAPIYDVEQLVNDPHVIAPDTITLSIVRTSAH